MLRSLRKAIRYLVLAAMLLAVTLCAVEVGLRVRRAMLFSAAADQAVDGEHPWIVPSATTYIEMQPGATFVVSHPDTGAEVALRTNSLGLRGSEIRIPKPADVIRILCLGDETTLAAGVEEQAAYPAQLRQYLSAQSEHQVEVINAGINQGCPLLSLIHLRQRWLALEPDLIILHFDMTDVRDDQRLRPWVGFDADTGACFATHPALRPRDQQQWQCWQDEFLVAQWGTDTLWDNWSPSDTGSSRVDINSRAGGEAWLRDDPPDWDAYIRHALEPIAEIKRMADAIDCGFMLTTAPRPWQTSPRASSTVEARQPFGVGLDDHYRSRRPFEILDRFAQENYIPFLDCSPSFVQYAAPEDLFLMKSPDLSELGHQLYAYELALAAHQLLPELRTAQAATPWADN